MLRHIPFEAGSSSYPVAVLMKHTAFNKQELISNYINPLKSASVAAPIIAFTLDYDAKSVSVKFAKEYLAELMPVLKECGTTHIYCTDAAYFKLLAGLKKTDGQLGYVLPCKIAGFEHMKVVLGVNYQQLIYKPDLQSALNQSLAALASDMDGSYEAPGTGIIHKAIYPEGIGSIRGALQALLEYPELSCDIEAFSLRFYEAGIGTIAFAPDQHRFVAFPCDYKPNIIQPPLAEKRAEFGRFVPDPEVRQALKWFFENYKGKLVFHNAAYDVKVIVYTLWMKSLWDTAGLLEGLEVMTRGMDDTKIIAYLATNSTAGNVLGLKPLAQEFAGNYAVDDIKDIRLIPLDKLLQYNGVDALSTHYVKAKYWPVMVKDRQLDLYNGEKHGLFMKSQKLIIQMELTGMPMYKAKIIEVKAKLEGMQQDYETKIRSNPLIQVFESEMTGKNWEKDFEERKAKAKHPENIKPKDRDTFPRHEFNPNSGPQLQGLLYGLMGLPVIDLTDTKQPATGAETLEKLINHVTSLDHKDLITNLIGHGQVGTILSTFIPSFEKAIPKDDGSSGIVWLFGSFNLGGTVSGRLSSSKPNLQNLPAKSIFGKLIKECFVAPEGWLFTGADFNSLEDMISALTTKDPNKLKVYTQGFDGHALRAVYYYRDELLAEGIDIDPNDPKSVNQLKKWDHWARQQSKTPTFALTYQGTYHTLMANEGWDEEKAKRIEANYHTLYKVSDDYIASRLQQASIDGYVEVAFGLRVRTPLIAQVLWGTKKIPYEAAAEGRTAGNAMGQSYCLLNNRAAVDFWEKVWASPYRLDILPSALIHDAIYPIIRNDPVIVEWANRELIRSMQWQELPEIKHDEVKLGAALDIFWPHWANAIGLPNDADQATIIKVCQEGKAAYLKPKEK